MTEEIIDVEEIGNHTQKNGDANVGRKSERGAEVKEGEDAMQHEKGGIEGRR